MEVGGGGVCVCVCVGGGVGGGGGGWISFLPYLRALSQQFCC